MSTVNPEKRAFARHFLFTALDSQVVFPAKYANYSESVDRALIAQLAQNQT